MVRPIEWCSGEALAKKAMPLWSSTMAARRAGGQRVAKRLPMLHAGDWADVWGCADGCSAAAIDRETTDDLPRRAEASNASTRLDLGPTALRVQSSATPSLSCLAEGPLYRSTMLSLAQRLLFVAILLAALFSQRLALAETLAAPVGGAAVPLPNGRLACGAPGGGWQVEDNGKRIKPPTEPALIGKSTSLRLAGPTGICTATKLTLDLVATGPLPQIDRRSIDLWLDEGHLDLKGTALDGALLEWQGKAENGSDRCVATTLPNGQQSCSFSVTKKLPADLKATSLRILPAGALAGAEIFDTAGRPVSEETLTVTPTRVVLGSILASERLVDLSTGSDRLELTHPESVVYADCDNGRCQLTGNAITVRGETNSARAISLRLRLAPRVFTRQGENLTQTVTIPLDVTYCPLTVVSVPPLRDTDDVRVVVRADARCAAGSENIRWVANGSPITVIDTETRDQFVYVLLAIGRISSDKLTLAAMRSATDASVIGLTSVATAPPPQMRVQLHLPGFGEIDFIPTNRDAILSVTAPNLRGRLVLLPVSGVYSAQVQQGKTHIRGEAGGGFVIMRFALRDDTLPGDFAEVDLARVHADVQRAVKEVSIAVPLGVSGSQQPIAEVLCTSALGKSIQVTPGVPLHIHFARRDGCRLVIHRNRIPREFGEQRLNVNISVTSVAGTVRPEGNFDQRLRLRHGSESRVIWLRGVKSQFDRITVRVTHVSDESQYLNGGEQIEVPAGQWTVVVENTRWRLYATAAIPVQLFRFSNDPGGAGTGPLALNMGVLTRFTWVTRDGAEGILGLEAGVMAMGLARENTHQLNMIGGIGFGVPLGGAGQPSQTSINIHAWAAYRLGEQTGPRLDPNGNPIAGQFIDLRQWAFIFGPSVTMGNLGFDI